MTMTSLESWTSLAERVEKVDGADREIDVAVYFRVACEPIPPEGTSFFGYRCTPGQHGYQYMLPNGIPTDGTTCPLYTASVDAVLALISETLPGWAVELKHDWYIVTGWVGQVERDIVGTPHLFGHGKGKEPQGALLAAYCRARAASVIEIAGSGER